MRKIAIAFFSASILGSSAFAYDTALAQKMNDFYSHIDFNALSASKLTIKPDTLMEELKKGSDILLLDIRTKEEQSVIKLALPNSIEIPLNELFTPQNLAKLPADKTIVVVCHSGTRATPAAFNLKMLGFKKVHILENGIVGFAQFSAPKYCPIKK
jgi:rhodanese-related sulfurtransferase